MTEQEEQLPQLEQGAGEKNQRAGAQSTAALLAKSSAKGESLAGTLDPAAALLAGVVRTASAFSASAVP